MGQLGSGSRRTWDQQRHLSTHLWHLMSTTATLSWQNHRDPPQTSCNELWMLLPTSSATHRSTTVACLFCSMKSCMHWLDVVDRVRYIWQYWHTVRYMGPLHSTWQASSRRRRRSLDVSTCDLLLNRNWSFHDAVGRRLAVGRFRWQVRRSGMHYRTVWEIQRWL